MDDIYDRFHHLLDSLDLVWLDPEAFAKAVHEKGAPLTWCWGFIDGTPRPIARPVRNQRIMYSGHKRTHCLKFQVLYIKMLNERKQTSFTRQNITAKESHHSHVKAVQAVMQGRELEFLLLYETHLIILIKDNYNTLFLSLYILFVHPKK